MRYKYALISGKYLKFSKKSEQKEVDLEEYHVCPVKSVEIAEEYCMSPRIKDHYTYIDSESNYDIIIDKKTKCSGIFMLYGNSFQEELVEGSFNYNDKRYRIMCDRDYRMILIRDKDTAVAVMEYMQTKKKKICADCLESIKKE